MNRSHIKDIKSSNTDCKENQFEEFQDLLHRNFKYFSYIVFSNKLVEYNSIKNESSKVIEDCYPEAENGCHLNFPHEGENEKENYFHTHSGDLNYILSNSNIEVTNIHTNNIYFQQIGSFDI